MYHSIEECKDDLVTLVVFGREPNHDTYTAAMKTRAMKRSAAYEGCSIERALANVPHAIQYINKELSRIQTEELQAEIDRRVWYALNPPHELSKAERELLADLEHALTVAENCDAYNVNTVARVAEIRRKIAKVKGEYFPY